MVEEGKPETTDDTSLSISTMSPFADTRLSICFAFDLTEVKTAVLAMSSLKE
jgi:hypothetical protein